MAKFIDFPIIYGKIGMHPGNLNTEQAIALFNAAMATPAGGKLVEYWPDGGRSTALLGAVAKNLDAKLTVWTAFERQVPAVELWFNRAVKTHKLAPVLNLNPDTEVEADFTAVRDEFLKAADATKVKSKKLFVLGKIPEVIGQEWALAETGPGYSIWNNVKNDPL